jgi:predicted LPLAT superfamily acyltransferase
MEWHKNKELSAGYLRLRILFAIYRILGTDVLKLFVAPVAFFTFCFATSQRKASVDYFARLHSFTGLKSVRPSFLRSLRHFINFSFSLVDRLQAWDGRISTASMDVANPDILDKILAQLSGGQGHFILSSHVGNMEMLRGVAASKDIKINAFIDMLHTKQFSDFLQSVNPDNSTYVYSTASIGVETAIIMQEKIQNGEIVVMAADRLAENGNSRYIEVPFLGSKARLPLGAFKFAKLMECDLYSYFIFKKDKRFELHLLEYPMGANEEDCALLFIRKIEELIQIYPYQWFNFYSYFY